MAAGDPGTRKRNYSATAIETTLINSITSAATGDTTTSVAVVSVSGFPSAPFTLIIGPDTSKEEVVTVTSVVGTTLQIKRGEDSTAAVAHAAGTAVRHGVSAREFKELQTHIAARGYDADSSILANVDSHVHGLVSGDGSVVGSTQAVTLTRKTLGTGTSISSTVDNSSGTISGGTVTSAVITTSTVTASTVRSSTLTNDTLGSDLAAGGYKVTGLGTPTSTGDSATKGYVDGLITTNAAYATAAATSATSAAASATAAATSATSAAASATTAAASVATIAGYATTASNSASAAATSATSSANSATASATSAGASATSATAAATSATSAAASATAAATSATSAAVSASAAATSATSAAASATAAANSATASAASASAAATSATNAAASATAAATSATSAVASATAAATSATSAAASATAAAGYVVPSQTGNSGKALTTDGTTASWSTTINGTAIPASKTLVTTDTTAYVSTAGGSTITVASGTTVPLTIQNNGTGNSFVVNDIASDTTPFVIDGGGAVGIGVAPSYPLQVFSPGTSTTAGDNIVARFQTNGSGYDSTIVLSDNVANSSSISMLGGATIFRQNGVEASRITASGNVGIGTSSPSAKLHTATSADEVIRFESSGNPYISWYSGATRRAYIQSNSGSTSFIAEGVTTLNLGTNNTTRIAIDGSGNTTINAIAAGTTSTAAVGGGYMGMPQNATTTGAYTVAAADAGKHIYSTATRTVTIDSNANLALPVGTVVSFISGASATTTIAITTDTMYLAGAGTTGSRTLAAYGMATAVKVASTTWYISGNGLT